MRSRALRFHLGVHDKRQDLSASAGAVALRTRDLLRFFALSITLTQPRSRHLRLVKSRARRASADLLCFALIALITPHARFAIAQQVGR